MAIASELALPSNGVIVDYYNRRNSRVLKIDAIKVNPAEDASGMPDGDTTTTLVGLRPTDINGITRVYYNRLNLDLFFNDETLTIPKESYRTISDILLEIYHYYGVNITAKEIYPVRIPKSFKDGATPLVLNINTNKSVLYKGAITIKVNYEPLIKRLPIRMLNGFEIPAEV